MWTSDRFPDIASTKNGRATDSCFAHVWTWSTDWILHWAIMLLYPPGVKHYGFNRTDKGKLQRFRMAATSILLKRNLCAVIHCTGWLMNVSSLDNTPISMPHLLYIASVACWLVSPSCCYQSVWSLVFRQCVASSFWWVMVDILPSCHRCKTAPPFH